MGQRAELVIDASAMDMEDLIDRMELLEKEIDSTEDLLSLKLDTMRNQILKSVGIARALELTARPRPPAHPYSPAPASAC